MKNKSKIFNDPVHGFISIYNQLVFNVIEQPVFQRLRRIKQLALSEYVYPGALHTRFHHALGAMHLMHLAVNTLKNKGVVILPEEEEAVILGILLHDVGHGPNSHTLEHCLIKNVSHEEISLAIMKQLNQEFNGKLNLTIQIFTNEYPKKFLHQLISSQLDVDRLDYLIRDSYFTGVSEGVIGYDRIIKMMDVVNDQLVIEAKGVYSVEKFIISRRIMYWQVYMHKTVLCVEEMLVQAIERAKELIRSGIEVNCSEALAFFLKKDYSIEQFQNEPGVINHYTLLDDIDIFAALKLWQFHPDKILSTLSDAIVNRKLFKIQIKNEAFEHEEIERLRKQTMEKYRVSAHEANYLVFFRKLSNHAYNPRSEKISVLHKNGEITDIAEASDQLNIMVLSKPVIKYYLCYPKDL